MKSNRRLFKFVILTVFQVTIGFGIIAQDNKQIKSIETNRKGEITVKAEPGSNVIIEQVNHEFWFGCAIPNSLFDGSMSEENRKIFKQKESI